MSKADAGTRERLPAALAFSRKALSHAASLSCAGPIGRRGVGGIRVFIFSLRSKVLTPRKEWFLREAGALVKLT